MTIENGFLAAPVAAPGPARLGATPLDGERTRFAVWAPHAGRVDVLVGPSDRPEALEAVGDGYHTTVAQGCPAGTRYRYVLDGGEPLADPASRLQPDGVLGPSEVVDLGTHDWGDTDYRPRPLFEHVISECHVGTLTEAGTFDAAAEALDPLVEAGFTAIELMPVAQFPGARNWGYDGVFPFAVQCTYGGPAGLQRLVDACHRRGMAVVLDVVYNHIGPVGNVLGSFGPYFSERYKTPWGPAINFDGPSSDHVRTFFLQTVAQWFVDFHIDALRLDAIHSIADSTATPFLAELSALAGELRERLGRPCALIAESSDNNPLVVTPRRDGGIGMDAQWNDDFHHALHAAVTGERQGYYEDFGSVEDIARAMREGFVYQGEYSRYRRRRHGAPSVALEPERFVVFAQNHDHIGNRPRGERLASLAPVDRQRLATALLLVSPGVPLLFMGEEYGETAPFGYFVDHGDDRLAEAVRAGRAEQMHALGYDEEPLDASAESTFAMAVIDPGLRHHDAHRDLLALHRRLVELRRNHPALARSRRDQVEVSVSGPLLVLTRRHRAGAVAALFNIGAEPACLGAPALVTGAAPGDRRCWRRLLDSADPQIGGSGPPQPESVAPGHQLVLGPWGFCLYASAPAAGVP